MKTGSIADGNAFGYADAAMGIAISAMHSLHGMAKYCSKAGFRKLLSCCEL